MYITIETYNNVIDVRLNDYAPVLGYDRIIFNRNVISNVTKAFGSNSIRLDLETRNFSSFDLSLDGNNKSLIVTSINGESPVNLEDLHKKIGMIL